MIQLAKEFGFKISSFHHGVEAYKVLDLLVTNTRDRTGIVCSVCCSCSADARKPMRAILLEVFERPRGVQKLEPRVYAASR